MLRPASPLSALVFAAFALLLLAIISPPILTVFPLAQFNGVSYGIFGTCSDAAGCSSIKIGYDVVTGIDPTAFNTPDTARSALAPVLVIHLVAAVFTILFFVLAVFTHLRFASNSPCFLTLLVIVAVLDFFLCLVSFLVDYLLFAPHLSFASYLVLAATAVVLVATVFSFAMQRVIAGRKRRERAVAFNAEMSGENYYTRETLKSIQASQGQPVPLSEHSVTADILGSMNRVSDERIPLTMKSPSDPFSDSKAIGGRFANNNSSKSGKPESIMWDPSRKRGSGGYGQMGATDSGQQPSDQISPRGTYLTNPFRQGMPLSHVGMGVSRGVQDSTRSPDHGPYSYQSPPNSFGSFNSGRGAGPLAGSQHSRVPAHQARDLPRAESPPPLGGGSSSEISELEALEPVRYGFGNLRASDPEIAGLVGLQQGRGAPMQPANKYTFNGGKRTPDRSRDDHIVSPEVPMPRQVYYEDVSPRFAVEPSDRMFIHRPAPAAAPAVALVKPPRARSPANSDQSHLSSVSQRGVNPRWNAAGFIPPLPASFRFWGGGGQTASRPAATS